ncbi:MAG: hypothetical protein IJ327_06020 [Lachnospiraceae bacterium]|nr:hypothetical protein [Lachnospiraceae bacterium]
MITLFLAAVVYLFFQEKRKPLRLLFVYMPVVMLVLYFNPLFFSVFERIVGAEIYFRILWLLPITWVLAYTAVSLYQKVKEQWKLPLLLLMLLMVPMCGRCVYSSPLFSAAENVYHVPDYVVEICDDIKVEGREVMAVFPREFLLYVRQYSPLVCMPYGRDAIIYQGNPFYKLMESEQIEAGQLAEFAKAAQCHYIILDEDKEVIGNLLDYDYEEFNRISGYVIYRDTTIYIGL